MATLTHMNCSISHVTYDADTHYPWTAADQDIVKGGKLRFHDGKMALPEGPGLGVEIDRDQMAKLEENVARVEYRRHSSRNCRLVTERLPHQISRTFRLNRSTLSGAASTCPWRFRRNPRNFRSHGLPDRVTRWWTAGIPTIGAKRGGRFGSETRSADLGFEVRGLFPPTHSIHQNTEKHRYNSNTCRDFDAGKPIRDSSSSRRIYSEVNGPSTTANAKCRRRASTERAGATVRPVRLLLHARSRPRNHLSRATIPEPRRAHGKRCKLLPHNGIPQKAAKAPNPNSEPRASACDDQPHYDQSASRSATYPRMLHAVRPVHGPWF